MSAPKAPEQDRLLAELDALLGASPRGPADPPGPPPLPELPAAGGPEPLAPAPAPGATTPAQVLIIEDNKDFRKVVRYLLSSNGYRVSEAGDGVEGLEAVRKGPLPDLLILDFEMPRMNGYELLQALRSDDETRRLPVILLTGAANRRHLRTLGLDVAELLEKPISNADLLQAVSRVTGRLGAPASEPLASPLETGEADVPGAEAEKEAELAAVPEQEEVDAEETQEEEGGELLIEEQKKEAEEEATGLDVLAADSPLVNRINRILVRAVEMGASDVHIEPQERGISVRVRVDGTLRALCRLPLALAPQVAARVKIMSNLTITERRRPQDGQIRAVIKGRKVEFRVSTLPSVHGEKIVLRILGGAQLKAGLGELGLCPRDLDSVRRALESPHGLILVTGPTGSGKTTTLYTMLRQLNRADVNIMTAEDPVEYELPGITQVQVRPHIGLTFESILRSFLRQDPDIMLVGEIRDGETAEIAAKAAITGHLVLSTLHTNSAPAAVMRLTHMGLAPYLVADSLKLVLAQRLVRRICAACRAPAPVPEEIKRLAGAEASERLASASAGTGCAACSQTGCKGRLPIFESMEVRTPELRHLILSGAGLDALGMQAAAEGMRELRLAALEAVAGGETTVDEALSILLS